MRVASTCLAPRDKINPALRERLAQELGCKEPTVTNILNRKRTMGLDVFYKLHVRMHRSADDLLDIDPPTPKAPARRPSSRPSNTLMLHEPESDDPAQ